MARATMAKQCARDQRRFMVLLRRYLLAIRKNETQMMVVHQNMLSSIMLKNDKPMEMSDFSWQHQKYDRPEIFVASYATDICAIAILIISVLHFKID